MVKQTTKSAIIDIVSAKASSLQYDRFFTTYRGHELYQAT